MSDDLEKEIALYEAERNRAWHSWFAARGHIPPTDESTLIFDGGFRMAWELCRAQPAPQPVDAAGFTLGPVTDGGMDRRNQQPTEQQPAPDVEALVEALTELCDEIDKHEIHAAISKTSISWFKRKARKALAAWRQSNEGK